MLQRRYTGFQYQCMRCSFSHFLSLNYMHHIICKGRGISQQVATLTTSPLSDTSSSTRDTTHTTQLWTIALLHAGSCIIRLPAVHVHGRIYARLVASSCAHCSTRNSNTLSSALQVRYLCHGWDHCSVAPPIS